MPHKHLAPTQYPILDCLSHRWSPQAFDPDRTVSDAVLHRLFEAARWAASSYNEQPWRFIVARRDTETAGYEKAVACLVGANQSWARQAPVLVLTAVATRFAHNNAPNRCATHDLGLAVGNLSAQATHEGLCVHQMGGVILDKVRETYGMPAGFDPFTAMAIGHPAQQSALPDNRHPSQTVKRHRKAFDEFVFGGQWDVKSGIF